jgi:hypothetical protein
MPRKLRLLRQDMHTCCPAVHVGLGTSDCDPNAVIDSRMVPSVNVEQHVPVDLHHLPQTMVSVLVLFLPCCSSSFLLL